MLIKDGPFAGLKKNGYRALLCDCPWRFLVRSEKGMDRSPDNHYSTMTLEELKALPVRDLVHPDGAVLHFWVIDTHVEMALEVLKAWGFTYKTVGFYWAKTNADGSFFTGMGFWTRACAEHAYEAYFGETEQEVERSFLATIGRPKRVSKSVRRLLVSPRREHSRKPDEIHERIEALTDGPYLEMFARNWWPRWSNWGNESSRFGGDPEVENLI
jgi:N6-adenosine-specific RNA methylase IME4